MNEDFILRVVVKKICGIFMKITSVEDEEERRFRIKSGDEEEFFKLFVDDIPAQ